MALLPVTMKCLLATAALLWIAPFSRAGPETTLSSPLPNDNHNCTSDLYVQLPFQVYYANPGDPLCIICNSNATSMQTGDPALISFVKEVSKIGACFGLSSEECVVDSIEDTLCFPQGIPEASFGDYLCRQSIFTITDPCEVPFTITKAVEPSYTYSADSPSMVVLEHDHGLLLMPDITDEGLPPAEYVWEYSLNNTNFVTLSDQSSDTYVKDPVEASGRGFYRFFARNMANQANPTYLNYQVTVNFSPIITLITEPAVTDPLTTTDVKVRCLVISHPQLTGGVTGLKLTFNGGENAIATTTSFNILDNDLAIHSMTTSDVTGCPNRVYTCVAENSIGSSSSDLAICNAIPMITHLMVDVVVSTNTSAQLVWTVVNEHQGVKSYCIEYRTMGGEYATIVLDNGNQHFYEVENLQPRTFYEFRVKLTATSDEVSNFTAPVNFTTYSQPTEKPYGLIVDRIPASGGQDIIALRWMAVPSTALYNVTGYEVVYSSSVAPDSFVRSTTDQNFSLSTTEVIVEQTYYFRVRAVGRFGVGPLSAQVESSPVDRTSANDIFNISITTLQLKDDRAYMAWSTSGGQASPIGISINISQFDPQRRTLVLIRTITLDVGSTEACFYDLNETDRYQYQFCVLASMPDGTTQYTCRFPTTTNELPATEISCVSVTDSITSAPIIPGWAIGAIVAGSVLLVLVIFGGCGLYVAVKRRSVHMDFKEEEPYSSFGLDKDIPGIINGGYSSRSLSPPRSCMQSYRHNHNQHQMEWSINNPMDNATAV